jgi:hypothetical protein
MDDDNMVKPIRDALNHLVYEADRQIRYSELIQINIEDPVKVRYASRILMNAYANGEEFLYVRIEAAPLVLQLPR